jgi:hypothetical protein
MWRYSGIMKPGMKAQKRKGRRRSEIDQCLPFGRARTYLEITALRVTSSVTVLSLMK